MLNTKEREQTQNNEQIGIVTTRSNVFNEKKNKLKAFSENLPEEADLPSVPISGGLFGWFNYDVTGSDLNKLTTNIQEKMTKQNEVIRRTIKEFDTIYNTFSALDKEYIQGILVSLKAAEEANSKALKGIAGVQENQNEIKQIINQQKQVIQVLKNFKEKIEKIEHLADVDKIFVVFSTMQSNVKAIEENIEAQELRVADLTDEMKELLSLQSVFQANLNHLQENQIKQFQTMKQQVSNQNESISEIKATSKENNTNIETLSKEVAIYGEKLDDLKRSIQDDIQALSEKVTRNNSEFNAKLHSTTNEVRENKMNFENAIKEINVGIEKQAESMSSYVESELSRANSEIKELSLLTESLSKVLKTTKVISFASIAITCVLVILIISGVL
ncbi:MULTISPECIES: hypothetical protein [Bacillus cereus group]|uniref:hypothetical protein n=1 Tax=Bacillus cereus group TaxID=86661 RepID=UPI0002790B76|nr:hypothetical protein [Bacillus paranthracis]EJP99106.1 hypothetical protein IC5_04768 [Bacillus cereus AND1407]KAB7639508.1 hypothetical protein GBN96_07820 [Bacillus sp. B4-WWTP-NA-D-NA-NA]KFL84945.1 hypothetical protein DJ51_3781 [Bacillus cereus]MRA60887.1 hypothetical protein [Bacillus thuringiensis]OUC01130.1 hypothetical protein BK752_02330 [Bacillus thuringiensis serovar canadensis]